MQARKPPRRPGRQGEVRTVFIHEAISARTEERPYITRESWSYPTSAWHNAQIRILPTNTPDCCVIESVASNGPRRGWQPMAEDLAADDWVAVGD